MSLRLKSERALRSSDGCALVINQGAAPFSGERHSAKTEIIVYKNHASRQKHRGACRFSRLSEACLQALYRSTALRKRGHCAVTPNIFDNIRDKKRGLLISMIFIISSFRVKTHRHYMHRPSKRDRVPLPDQRQISKKRKRQNADRMRQHTEKRGYYSRCLCPDRTESRYHSP